MRSSILPSEVKIEVIKQLDRDYSEEELSIYADLAVLGEKVADGGGGFNKSNLDEKYKLTSKTHVA